MLPPRTATAVPSPFQSSFYDRFHNSIIEETNVLGSTLKVKHGSVPTNQLLYWDDNPRLYTDFKIAKEKKPSQERLHDLIAEHSLALKEAIKISGATQDAILVNSKGEVVEGNRRLWSYRTLQSEGEKGFDSIPVQVLPPETTEEQILSLIAVRHVSGQKEWDSIGKANILTRLMNMKKTWTIEKLAKHLQTKPAEIKKSVTALGLIVTYQTRTKDYDPLKFTHFSQLAGSKGYRLMEDNQEMFDWFITMVHKGRLEHSHHSAKTDKLYVNKKARAILEREGSHAAMNFLNDNKDGKVVSTARKMYRIIDKLNPKEILGLQNATTEKDKKDKEWLTVLRRSLNDLFEAVEEDGDEELMAAAAK